MTAASHFTAALLLATCTGCTSGERTCPPRHADAKRETAQAMEPCATSLRACQSVAEYAYDEHCEGYMRQCEADCRQETEATSCVAPVST